jgi:pimeloyl-ACP methyl ester carboxylesterase
MSSFAQSVAVALTSGLTLGLAGMSSAAFAQSKPEYVQFEPSATKGALYVPDSGARKPVAFVAIHRTSNFMDHISAKELSKRGYTVLGMNPRSDNNESLVDSDDISLDIKQGVEYLKGLPGITKVILIGHSGGGPSSSYYQAVAENGIGYCNGAEKLDPCTKELTGLPKADAMVLLDPHPGYTINNLRGLNPAVTDEADPSKLDPSLNPFLPANGFVPGGDSQYSEEFIERYSKAQSERMNRLIDKAKAIKAEIDTGKHVPPDNDAFIVYRDRARLSDVSTGVYCCTLKPQKFLKNDGTIVTQIAKTVRRPEPQNIDRDASLEGGAMFASVKSFLSSNSIRSNHAINGIDVCSSNNSTFCAVQSIKAPTLVVSMNGHYFVRDGEEIFNRSASPDKDYIVIDGATHGMTPCKPCAKVTGEDYSNATKNLFDYVAKWVDQRFPS